MYLQSISVTCDWNSILQLLHLNLIRLIYLLKQIHDLMFVNLNEFQFIRLTLNTVGIAKSIVLVAYNFY